MQLNLNNDKLASANVDDYSPIPEGKYTVQAVDSKEKFSNAGNKYLSITFEVLGPSQQGRKVFMNLNLWHEGDNAETVQDIAYKQLALLCDAMGITRNVTDSSQLHGKPVLAKITVDGSYNRIGNFSKTPSANPPAAQAAIGPTGDTPAGQAPSWSSGTDSKNGW